ncbi:hypothetical protein FRC09_001335 [Ceratobasidium sp. 395]|nr:hypothetical protein FRC09_001335 [Ceratobasidium sp. 395]
MEFHSEWRHPDCSVMRWYDSQRATSTTFQSVEHRRDVNGPFFHEFLLFTLADGAICRVERVGEGSRSDAIREVGCTAHDLVQWFDAEDYAKLEAKHPSVLIAQIQFRRTFDILDVLAVCYTIQKTKTCNTYTLQRYNCYFLCLTVLAMLTRQMANWEQVWDADITKESWRSASDKMSGFVLESQYSKSRRVRRLQHGGPGDLPLALLEDVRKQCKFSEENCSRIQKKIPSVLWMPQLDHVDDGWHSVKGFYLLAFLAELWDAGMFGYAFAIAQSEEALLNSSQSVLAGLTMATETAVGQPEYKSTGGPIVKRSTSSFPQTYGMGVQNGVLWLLVAVNLGMITQTSLGWLSAVSVVSMSIISYFFRNRDHHRVQTELTEREITGALGGVPPILVHYLGVAQHRRGLLWHPAWCGPAVVLMKELLISMSRLEADQMDVHVSDGSGSRRRINSAVNFQQSYIKPRLHTHAKRVAAHQLGMYSSVYMDIHETMTEVWQSMPRVEKHTPMKTESSKCHMGQDTPVDLRHFVKTLNIVEVDEDGQQIEIREGTLVKLMQCMISAGALSNTTDTL